MLRIKLSRGGKKKQPTYRILVMEKSKDPWGTFLENVGTYNPRTTPSTIDLNEERIKHWISKGAQPTDSVHNLLVQAGVVDAKKRNVSKLGKKVKVAAKKEAEDAKKAAAEAKAAKEAPAEEKPATEEAPKEEAPAETPKAEEKKEETPAEAKADTPAA